MYLYEVSMCTISCQIAELFSTLSGKTQSNICRQKLLNNEHDKLRLLNSKNLCTYHPFHISSRQLFQDKYKYVWNLTMILDAGLF